MSVVKLKQGDCLELMKSIPDGSVDMILADLPYGTTSKNKWDTVIPFEPMWRNFNRIIKENGAILLFSQMPFGAKLIESNLKMFRYEWIYEKSLAQGFLNANRMPMRTHENILVFYNKLPTYNPQKSKGEPYDKGLRPANNTSNYGDHGCSYSKSEDGSRYPRDVIKFNNANHTKQLHPTQKPVALLEYLIRTYTNPGETVLDNVMGSGSTGVAAVNTGRNFIGIELDQNYFDIAVRRIEAAEHDRP